ncbi:hypothetical protein EVG20_g1687 [Dentipellis fragilis]|uniref:H/ACA ribonucleoprotein complex non-core subunit NAF1 n=1 Tax=Dentipellis fragilis TaxID=205917 RepID=A0A4Y9ZAZ9_9AGAM|nr:hypothetical protein EVG20_g1687 [Dentipellis fragilis]
MEAPFFKVPEIVPQDLLLIQDLVGQIQKAPEVPHAVPVIMKEEEDDIASSDDGANSEDEVEAEVLPGGEEEGSGSSKSTGLSDSSSDSSSDSDTDVEEDIKPNTKRKQVDDEDDEDGEPSSTAVLRTKNELPEGDIIVPQISEVGPDERLEKVGEIMSIIDKVAIVKGHASHVQNRASEKALDSDTLLVFEDRKVLGHVFETFGPTYQPLYQIKFTSDFPLNPDQVKIGREVFHIPQRSNFVFLAELKRIKGSDASNVHDEEPADYELEFSDDEEEAAYKARAKQRRQASRDPSVAASSRHSTPVPSRYTTPSRHHDMAADSFYGSNPFDAHGPYDMDYGVGAGPSRPAPKPYDDPYSDEYNAAVAAAALYGIPPSESGTSVSPDPSDHGEYGRNRGRGRGKRPDRGGRANRDHESRSRPYDRGGRGRGRDRGRGSGDAYSGGRGGHQSISPTHPPRSLSPTSLAIATATGQFPTDSGYAAAGPSQAAAALQAAWSYDPYQPQQNQQQMFAFGGHAQPYVQPHINPRFASQLGFNMGFMGQGQQPPQQQQQQQHPQYSQYGAGMGGYGANTAGQAGQGWSGQWDYSNGPLPHGQAAPLHSAHERSTFSNISPRILQVATVATDSDRRPGTDAVPNIATPTYRRSLAAASSDSNTPVLTDDDARTADRHGHLFHCDLRGGGGSVRSRLRYRGARCRAVNTVADAHGRRRGPPEAHPAFAVAQGAGPGWGHENEPLIAANTKFLLTTNGALAPSNDVPFELQLNTSAYDRYFERPDVLKAYREQLVIQTPEFTTLPEHAAVGGRFRPRVPDEESVDTLDATYEKRHRKYETFEKRQRLREKEKLKHEHYKLKERIDQLRSMDAAAFMSIPDAAFEATSQQPESQATDGSISEAERRKELMLQVADTLEGRYRTLLNPEHGRTAEKSGRHDSVPTFKSAPVESERGYEEGGEEDEEDEDEVDELEGDGESDGGPEEPAPPPPQEKLKLRFRFSAGGVASVSPRKNAEISTPRKSLHPRRSMPLLSYQPSPDSSLSPKVSISVPGRRPARPRASNGTFLPASAAAAVLKDSGPRPYKRRRMKTSPVGDEDGEPTHSPSTTVHSHGGQELCQLALYAARNANAPPGRKTQRHKIAFGVKVPHELEEVRDFEIPHWVLHPESEASWQDTEDQYLLDASSATYARSEPGTEEMPS